MKLKNCRLLVEIGALFQSLVKSNEEREKPLRLTVEFKFKPFWNVTRIDWSKGRLRLTCNKHVNLVLRRTGRICPASLLNDQRGA